MSEKRKEHHDGYTVEYESGGALVVFDEPIHVEPFTYGLWREWWAGFVGLLSGRVRYEIKSWDTSVYSNEWGHSIGGGGWRAPFLIALDLLIDLRWHGRMILLDRRIAK